MNFSSFFIQRPRFSGVIAVVMVLVGLIALALLPISQYPQITPPQIIVSASYPGAGAEVLVNTVAIPIENAVNGIENMMYMSSSANDNGTYTLTITFNIGTDADIAQVKVENRLQQIKSLLPDVVNQEGLDIKVQSANILGFLVLESPQKTYSGLYLSNYAYANLQNPLERIEGMGNVNVYGPQYSMRIWLNPDKITSLGLTATDIVNAIEEQNIQAAVGSIGSAPADKNANLVLTLNAQGLLNSVLDFEEIIVAHGGDGGIVRLKDVATVEIGADSYQLQASYNNSPSVIIALSQLPNTNALGIMKAVKEEIALLQQTFPPDMELKLAYDSTEFVRASIQGIVSTLFITFFLVVLIVWVFLQNWRATLIPVITIPVSLIATFAVIYLIGFDLNILTLFAMILAIGLVVDDAIIVVERVEYLMKYRQMDRTSAAVQAMKDIGGSIVATTLVLLAIFVPVGMMVGLTGQIYKQFAVTIITAVLFSAVNALTLSPALCAVFLKNEKQSSDSSVPQSTGRLNHLFLRFNTLLATATKQYQRIVGWLGERLLLTICIIVGVIGLIAFGFMRMPTSFLPEEDQGVLFASIELPQTSSINQTLASIDEMTGKILKTPGVDYVIGIAGESLLGTAGENIGMLVIGLKPWSERTTPNLSMDAINDTLMRQFPSTFTQTNDFFALPAVPGVGTTSGLSFQLNAVSASADLTNLTTAVNQLLAEINGSPNFKYAFSTFTPDTPHIFLSIDRTKLESFGIPVSTVFNVLQQNLGSLYVNNVILSGQVNKVIIQADYRYRQSVEDVGNLYVQSQTGEQMPLKEFISFGTVMKPQEINRYNLYLTAGMTAEVAEGISTGTAIEQINAFMKNLSAGYRLAWTGLSLQEVETQGLAFILIGAALIFAYLFLVALYESWLVAFAVIFTNVFAILGALIGLWLFHLPVSLYAELGIVLLIGLASKNAILIVQFTNTYANRGMNIVASAIKGAGERFRAVVMTALTFILGVMPMIFASGAGAASQHALGVSVVFGMLVAVLIGILFIPALFVLFKTLSVKAGKTHSKIVSVASKKSQTHVDLGKMTQIPVKLINRKGDKK